MIVLLTVSVLVRGKNEKFFPKSHVVKYPNKFDPELVSAVKAGLVVPSAFLVPMPDRASTPVPSSGASPAPVSPSLLLKPTWVTAPAAHRASVHHEESEEETIPPETSSSTTPSGPAVVAAKVSSTGEDLSNTRKSSLAQEPLVVPLQGQQETAAPASPSSPDESEDYSMSPETVEEGETISARLSPRGGLKELSFGVPPPLPEEAPRPPSKTAPPSPVRVVPSACASAPPSAAPQPAAEVVSKLSPAPRRTVEVVIKSSSASRSTPVVAPIPSPGSSEPKHSALGLVPASSSSASAPPTSPPTPPVKTIDDLPSVTIRGQKRYSAEDCFPELAHELPELLYHEQVLALLDGLPYDQFCHSRSASPSGLPPPPLDKGKTKSAPRESRTPPLLVQRPSRAAKSQAKAKSKAQAKDEAQYSESNTG